MAKQSINLGISANDGTGDSLRTAMDKTNENFIELYNKTEHIMMNVGNANGVYNESVNYTVGTAKLTFRMPSAFTVSSYRASLITAATGSTFIVDINVDSTSVFGTNKLTIDINEKTSVTSSVIPSIATTALTDDQVITVDIDQVGSTVAGRGLTITLIGTQ